MPRLAIVGARSTSTAWRERQPTGDPRVRRNEMIDRILGDDRQLVLRPHLVLHFVGHDGAAKSGAHDDDLSHRSLSLRFPVALSGALHILEYHVILICRAGGQRSALPSPPWRIPLASRLGARRLETHRLGNRTPSLRAIHRRSRPRQVADPRPDARRSGGGDGDDPRRPARPEQIGAFLMLLRVKEETGDEIAGFVRAVRATLAEAGGPRRPRLAELRRQAADACPGSCSRR